MIACTIGCRFLPKVAQSFNDALNGNNCDVTLETYTNTLATTCCGFHVHTTKAYLFHTLCSKPPEQEACGASMPWSCL